MSRISEFSGPYHFLSNFHPSPVDLDGQLYPSVEHAYQAAKTIDAEERDIIRQALGPGMAKKLGRHASIRADWEDRKLTVMAELLMQKFKPGSGLADKLVSTGSAELIEGNWWGDRYWGVCKGQGSNHLGKLLMAIRKNLQEDHHEHSTA